LWLWLVEDGTPFGEHSWEAVFRAGSQRCARVLDGVVASPPFATPHMCRHSFALHMLVALHHAMDQRFGLTAEEDDDPGVADLLTRIAAASGRVQDTALDSGVVA
jgi:hypothetical protein